MKHERRVVGHVSGWQEQMHTCVCGNPWPCSMTEPKPETQPDTAEAGTPLTDALVSRHANETRELNERNPYCYPTNIFRWVTRLGSKLFGVAAISHIPEHGIYLVLQQKWESTYVGEKDEWRDVPIEEETK